MTRKGKKYQGYPLWRYIINRYAGIITASFVVLSVWIIYEVTYQEPEFFEQWSCPELNRYMLNDEGYGYTPHSELTEDQHNKLHEIFFNDCKDYTHEP